MESLLSPSSFLFIANLAQNPQALLPLLLMLVMFEGLLVRENLRGGCFNIMT